MPLTSDQTKAAANACFKAANSINPLTVSSLNQFGCYFQGRSVLIPPGLGTFGTSGRNIWRDSGIRNVDLSVTKSWKFQERLTAQFRAEFFNILNHPNFNAPNFGGNGVTAIGGSGNFTNAAFGQIGSTRDAPYDPRQIQFALKLYY